MATSTLTMKITFAWWFRFYLGGVAFFCCLMGVEPDMKRIKYWTSKAMKITTVSESKTNA